MADKDKSKARKTVKAVQGGTAAGGGTRPVAVTSSSLAADGADHEALKSELAAAKARIEQLEAANSEVVNRLSWMIDTLQALKDGVKG